MPQENRLAREASPYLRQHAKNPVDWYPWGSEALERAKREDKPILLSIGYAACHWCHVMERESFEDEAIARRMNELFVNVKVDREERPDLDHIYQLVVQLMGRSGGWPLTVFLTPEQRPFFAGTYFPPKDRYGMPGFPALLDAIADAYRTKRGDVEQQAAELTQAIARAGDASPRAGEIAQDVLRVASRKLLARFDTTHGGFGKRPKFPNTMALDVLLRRGALEGDRVALESATQALAAMRRGGIWDHLRGGFHRYSTDERWLVPHFEKMLYDNALLLRLYVDAFRATGDATHAETARAIVGWAMAEMRSPEGGFYASEDADSEGHEGKFFVWTPDELRAAMPDDDEAFHVAREAFGVTEEGNFEESGATVLFEARSIERVAAILDLDVARATAALERARQKLLAKRETRERPLRDDKILASWSSLFLGALADAGRALDEPRWIDEAARAFARLERDLVHDQGRVARFVMDGEGPSRRPGFLDDHAYAGNAALDLYEATGEPRYAALAGAIARRTIERFWDKGGAGFFFTPNDGDRLIARTLDAFDQAIPSGSAMAALLCLRLAAIADASLLEVAERQLARFAADALENPFGMAQTVLAMHRLATGGVDVVIVGDLASDEARALGRAAHEAYAPARSIAWIDPKRPETLAAAPVAAEGKPGPERGAFAYVCKGRTCSAPVRTRAELRALLDEARVPPR